jgi:hypothetical protein
MINQRRSTYPNREPVQTTLTTAKVCASVSLGPSAFAPDAWSSKTRSHPVAFSRSYWAPASGRWSKSVHSRSLSGRSVRFPLICVLVRTANAGPELTDIFMLTARDRFLDTAEIVDCCCRVRFAPYHAPPCSERETGRYLLLSRSLTGEGLAHRIGSAYQSYCSTPSLVKFSLCS